MQRLKSTAAVAAGVALFFGSACKDESGGSREMTIVVEADTERLQEKEGQLARQWSEIEAERERLVSERQALLSRMERGDDLARLAAEQRRILEREQALRAQESRAAQDRTALTEEITRIVQAASTGGLGGAAAAPAAATGGGEAAARATAEVARRESDLARREADLAEREKVLAEREARLAEREAAAGRMMASAAAAAPPQPGRRVTSAQVQQAQREVRRTMSQRGLIAGDLPPEVAALERRVYTLSREGRFDEALDTAASLGEAVRAIRVDEAFIQGKMSRLGRLRQGKQLSADQSRQVEELLAQATSAFADGRHADANTRLNRIFGILSN
jgi:hypothetical protein